MSTQDVIALQQVVVAKGIESSNYAHASVAHAQSGTEGEIAGKNMPGTQ